MSTLLVCSDRAKDTQYRPDHECSCTSDTKEAFASLNRFGIILLSREFEWRGDHDKSIGNVPKREGQEV